MTKRLLLLTLTIFFVLNNFAQINEGGKPISQSLALPKNISKVELPAVSEDWKKLASAQDGKNGTVEKVAQNIPTNFSLQNSGKWEYVHNGDRVWRLQITAKDAIAVNPLFKDFFIPKGAKLFIYSPDYKQVLGAYTDANNHSSELFSTEIIYGNTMILEYFEPAYLFNQGKLTIENIGSFFKDVPNNPFFPTGLGDSDTCEVNINCSPVGDNWKDEKRGVARILVVSPTGQGWCTGTLINNTAQDCKKYFLTALHCGDDATTANFNQWIFFFNYERSGCSNSSTPPTNSVTGATMISKGSALNNTSSSSDFMLLEINSTIPSSYNVYYNGWNTATTTSGGGVGIHHPAGDVKKISTFNATPTNVGITWSGNSYGIISGTTHWSFKWASNPNGFGVTEGGSSGSPMFDSNGYVIGTLSGGGSYCTAKNSSDQYGKMSYHWTSNGTANNRRLKPWLDPSNSGVTTLGGINPPCGPVAANDAGVLTIVNPTGTICGSSINPQVEIKNYGTATLTSVAIKYQVNTGTISTYNWTGSLASNATTTVTLNTITAPAGNNTFTAYTTNPNGALDGNTVNDTKTGSFTINAALSLPLVENFEGTTFPAAGFTLSNADNSVTWARTSSASFGTGTRSMYMKNWSYNNGNGAYDWLLTPTYDFSNVTGATLTYDLAYAFYKQTNGNNRSYDTLGIAVSIDCGNSFVWLWKEGGVQLATAGGLGVEFVPTAANWVNKTLDLSGLNNQSSVQFAFISISKYGNNLYIDNININESVVIVPTPPVANFSANATNTCKGSTVTFTDLSTNTPTSWAWSFPGGTPATSTAKNPTVTYNTAGNYNVTLIATNADGSNTKVLTNYIKVNNPPTLTLTATNVSCFGGSNGSVSAAATGAGGYTYSWTGQSSTSSVLSNKPAGTYTCTVTDVNGCSKTTTATISQPSTALGVNTTTNTAYCGNSNGSVIATGTGGTSPYTYSYSSGNGSNLSPGNYSVTVTDSKSCTFTKSFTIVNTAQPFRVNIATTNTSCTSNTGVAIASVVGGNAGYTFTWSNGQTGTTASNLSYGAHSLVTTNANGCTETSNFNIANANAPIINVETTDVLCPGFPSGQAVANITGGNPTYNVTWSSSNNTSITESNLAAGQYTVTVSDASNCTAFKNFTISEPAPYSVSFTTQSEHCDSQDGQIVATAAGGSPYYEYTWSNGDNGNVLVNKSAGTYNVSVTDQNGCIVQATATLQNIAAPSISNIVVTDVKCGNANNGAISLNISGGTGAFTTNWSNGATTKNLTNVGGGTYTLTVRDSENCTSDTTLTIEEPQPIKVLLTIVDESPSPTSVITANAAGGSEIFTYSWSNGDAGQTISDLAPGIYTLTITDNENCSLDTTINIGKVAIQNTVWIENINLYPNPVKKQLMLDMSLKNIEDIHLSILNIVGQKVYEKQLNDVQQTIEYINTSSFAEGVYYLQIESLKSKEVLKFVKTK